MNHQDNVCNYLGPYLTRIPWSCLCAGDASDAHNTPMVAGHQSRRMYRHDANSILEALSRPNGNS